MMPARLSPWTMERKSSIGAMMRSGPNMTQNGPVRGWHRCGDILMRAMSFFMMAMLNEWIQTRSDTESRTQPRMKTQWNTGHRNLMKRSMSSQQMVRVAVEATLWADGMDRKYRFRTSWVAVKTPVAAGKIRSTTLRSTRMIQAVNSLMTINTMVLSRTRRAILCW